MFCTPFHMEFCLTMACMIDSMEDGMMYQMILLYLLTASCYGAENILKLEVIQCLS